MTDLALGGWDDAADLLSDLGVGIVVVALDGRVVEANDHARAVFGAGPWFVDEESLARFASEIVDEHEQPVGYGDLPVVRAMRRGATIAGATFGFRRDDGSGTQWLLCGAHVVGGETDARVVCSFVDVTAQRVALDALNDRDRRFRHLAENAVDMIFRASVVPDLVFEYLNPAVETVMGYPRDDFYRDFDLALRLLHPDDRADVFTFFTTTLRNPVDDIDPIVARMTRRDGRLVWLQIRVVPIRHGGEVVAFEGIVRDVTALKADEADLRHRAHHDPLTGIPNRTSFLDALDRALDRTRAGEGGLAVLYLDLDRFKTVNDGLGHAAGDLVLTALAVRLAEAVRPSDRVGRIGGDEFAAVLPGLRDTQEAVHVATRLLDAIGEPLELEEGELVTTASIGVAFTDDGAQTSAELLRRADVAMYQAKDGGRARIECYTPRPGRGAARTPG